MAHQRPRPLPERGLAFEFEFEKVRRMGGVGPAEVKDS
jgi:hypothetical protein